MVGEFAIAVDRHVARIQVVRAVLRLDVQIWQISAEKKVLINLIVVAVVVTCTARFAVTASDHILIGDVRDFIFMR